MANRYRHIYSAGFTGGGFSTASGDIDIWQITAGAYPVTILEMQLGQKLIVSTDAKVPASIVLGRATAAGSGGSTATITKYDVRSESAVTTCVYMNDVEATGLNYSYPLPWVVAESLLYQPVPEARLTLAAGTMAVVRLVNPGYNITGIFSYITFAEWK